MRYMVPMVCFCIEVLHIVPLRGAEGGIMFDKITEHIQSNQHLLRDLGAYIEHEHPTWNYSALVDSYCFINESGLRRSALPSNFIRTLWQEIRRHKAHRIIDEAEYALTLMHGHLMSTSEFTHGTIHPFFFCGSLVIAEDKPTHHTKHTTTHKSWVDGMYCHAPTQHAIDDALLVYRELAARNKKHGVSTIFITLIDNGPTIKSFIHDATSKLFLSLAPIPKHALEQVEDCHRKESSKLSTAVRASIALGNFHFVKTIANTQDK